ncbi:MAG: hypothetical protein NZ953_00805 [Thaumarchaeota archaeon]|nr:hypothetical protein [Candidatus Calditenuaceae archaeon]MCX8203145.1 hypothetical protein [Nitrososphaeria archaeon]MDW8043940.1 hypothetical protein [Nitrososphaerota archaeon]
MKAEGNTIRLGLNLPLFIAATIAMGTGTLVGMMGIWGAAAWGRPVPEWEKVGHAHSSWWAVLIMIAAMVLPSLSIKPWAKKLIIAGTYLGPTLWVGVLATYYEIGGPAIWRVEAPAAPGTYYELPLIGLIAAFLEFLGFVALGIVGLSAAGVKLPLVSAESPPPKSKYELISDIEVPRRIFLIPTLAIALGVIVGFGINAVFKVAHRPISPAALVQLHDHTALIAVSSLIILMTMSVLRVSERVQQIGYRLMQVAVPLTIAGLFVFNFLGVHSLVWVAPAGIYYVLLLAMIPAALGYFTQKGSGSERGVQGLHVPAFRWGLAVIFAGLALLIATGAAIALIWDTNPNLTVTYKQPEGSPYPGPYPVTYTGTAPVRGTPRGLENAHLSPGSWYHVAAVWMIALMVFGPSLLGARLGLLILFAATIPLAPTFNVVGRYFAWLGIPNGIGALWFAGHPLKGFNLIALFAIAVITVYLVAKGKKQT